MATTNKGPAGGKSMHIGQTKIWDEHRVAAAAKKKARGGMNGATTTNPLSAGDNANYGSWDAFAPPPATQNGTEEEKTGAPPSAAPPDVFGRGSPSKPETDGAPEPTRATTNGVEVKRASPKTTYRRKVEPVHGECVSGIIGNPGRIVHGTSGRQWQDNSKPIEPKAFGTIDPAWLGHGKPIWATHDDTEAEESKTSATATPNWLGHGKRMW